MTTTATTEPIAAPPAPNDRALIAELRLNRESAREDSAKSEAALRALAAAVSGDAALIEAALIALAPARLNAEQLVACVRELLAARAVLTAPGRPAPPDMQKFWMETARQQWLSGTGRMASFVF